MTRSTLVLSAFLIFPGIALAQEPDTDSEPVDHDVVRGETLWYIAGRYYDDPFQWPRIYEANVDRIEDPHWIYPGQEFLIPGFGSVVLGSPEDRAVGQDRGDLAAGAQPGAAGAGAGAGGGAGAGVSTASTVYPGPGDPTVFSSPPRTNIQAPSQRTTFYGSLNAQARQEEGGVLAGARTEYYPVPDHVFYSASWHEPDREADLEYPGEVVGWVGAESHARGSELIRPYDEIEVAWDGSLPMEGSRLQLVRVEREVPRFGDVVRPTALARVVERRDASVVVLVSAAFANPHVGDRVLPAATYPLQAGVYARDGGPEVSGTITGFARDGGIQQQGEIAFIDVGAADGVAVGDVFAAQPNEDRPEEVAYELEVVRVFQDRASARVSRVIAPAFEPGVPVQRIRRMP